MCAVPEAPTWHCHGSPGCAPQVSCAFKDSLWSCGAAQRARASCVARVSSTLLCTGSSDPCVLTQLLCVCMEIWCLHACTDSVFSVDREHDGPTTDHIFPFVLTNSENMNPDGPRWPPSVSKLVLRSAVGIRATVRVHLGVRAPEQGEAMLACGGREDSKALCNAGPLMSGRTCRSPEVFADGLCQPGAQPWLTQHLPTLAPGSRINLSKKKNNFNASFLVLKITSSSLLYMRQARSNPKAPPPSHWGFHPHSHP